MTGTFSHIAEHGFTMEDVEEVLSGFDGMDRSRSSGNLVLFGWVHGNRRVAVVVEEVDDETVYPVTAYEVK